MIARSFRVVSQKDAPESAVKTALQTFERDKSKLSGDPAFKGLRI